MAQEIEKNDGEVRISVDIEGEYDEVMAKIQPGEDRYGGLDVLLEDAEMLLETVRQREGGTRSALAQALPETSSLAGDADAVVEMLHVLSRYDLVTLEGNTWLPGDRLQGR